MLHRASFVPVQRRLAHSAVSNSEALTQQSKKSLLNPPITTLPPTLTSPNRSDFESTPKYLFQLGKAYLGFYKNGLKAIWTNRKLLNEKLQQTPANERPSMLRPSVVPPSFSRADWVLYWRVRHDVVRLPMFGLIMVVCGEFTAFVVLLVDGVVPYTCRIPKQVAALRTKAEQRRKLAFNELENTYTHGVLSPGLTQRTARSHVLKTLHLAGAMWDKVGFMPPGMWQLKGRYRMAFLEGDDKNLVNDGGPMGLDPEELKIACMERGVDILGKSESELRSRLGDWLRLTAAEDISERRRRMTVLLLTR